MTLPTLEKLLQHRVLNAESLVWREGWPQWTPLAAITELKPLLGSLPPLLPLTPSKPERAKVTESFKTRRFTCGALTCIVVAAAIATFCFIPNEYVPSVLSKLRQKNALQLFIPHSHRYSDHTLTAAIPHSWRNPITGRQAPIDDGWTIKQIENERATFNSSFVSNNIIANLSVSQNDNQHLSQLVDYLKSHEPSLRFINTGTYNNPLGLSSWTGIATSSNDHDQHYVVHVIQAKTGYGILIAAIAQQTAASVNRLEALMTELDSTFKTD